MFKCTTYHTHGQQTRDNNKSRKIAGDLDAHGICTVWYEKRDYNEKQSGQGKQENKRQLNIQRRRTGSHAF